MYYPCYPSSLRLLLHTASSALSSMHWLWSVRPFQLTPACSNPETGFASIYVAWKFCAFLVLVVWKHYLMFEFSVIMQVFDQPDERETGGLYFPMTISGLCECIRPRSERWMWRSQLESYRSLHWANMLGMPMPLESFYSADVINHRSCTHAGALDYHSFCTHHHPWKLLPYAFLPI